MEDNAIHINPEDIEIVDSADYCDDVYDCYEIVPEVANPLLKRAKAGMKKIEKALYSTPAFIMAIRASVPKETFQAVLSNKQKEQLAKGALKLMTKKDGSLMANLVDPKTKKIVSTINLKSVKMAPELTKAMADYSTQMQMAQIAEEIQYVQIAVEEVRKGQENDRLAMAYSCKQKLLQAMAIKDKKLRTMALMNLASSAEDSRNLLMLSQNVNVQLLKDEPESVWGKIMSGSTPQKIERRMEEIRESLCAVNMVSFAEAMAYQEMGETESARLSLPYYSDYVQKTYLELPGFVQRLDMLDSSTKPYWSETIPDITKKIEALPCNSDNELIEEID